MTFPADITQWGPGTLLVLVVILILTGRLVPRSALEDQRKETALWRTAAQTEQATNIKNADTIANYAEAALVTQKVMTALQEKHRERESP
jgi:hypothetical protein